MQKDTPSSAKFRAIPNKFALVKLKKRNLSFLKKHFHSGLKMQKLIYQIMKICNFLTMKTERIAMFGGLDKIHKQKLEQRKEEKQAN